LLLKPFQASAAILEGTTESTVFPNEDIAPMCASHTGKEIHVKTVNFPLPFNHFIQRLINPKFPVYEIQ
jgi:L-asparaginase II